jgi:hypothetical protein
MPLAPAILQTKKGTTVMDNLPYLLTWAPALIGALNDWSVSGKAEIRRLTAWDNHAQSAVAPLVGLKHFELARDPKDGWTKLLAANLIAHDEVGRPIMWIDDQLFSYFDLLKMPTA